MAQVAGICGPDDGTELGVGWVRPRGARIPWTIRHDEVLTVFQGQLTLHAEDRKFDLHPRDSVWIPAGTELVHEADEALVQYAIHPADWQETGQGHAPARHWSHVPENRTSLKSEESTGLQSSRSLQGSLYRINRMMRMKAGLPTCRFTNQFHVARVRGPVAHRPDLPNSMHRKTGDGS